MAPASKANFQSPKVKTATTLKEKMSKEILEGDYRRYLENDTPMNSILPWFRSVEIVSAELTSDTTTRVTYRFPVLHEYLNPAQGLHGGLSAAFYDMATTWLLTGIRKPGFWMRHGTTRSLNLTYLRPASEGEMLVMETEIVHAGRRLCLLKAVLRRERDMAIISTCEHQKYNTDADEAKM